MQRRAIARVSLFLLVAAFAAGPVATTVAADTAAKPSLSNKWRIKIEGKADSDGTIVFRVTPKEGVATDVSVPIQKGSGDNLIAKNIVAAFERSLPENGFKSERDDGEDVLLKKKGSTPNFSLEIVNSNVLNTRLSLKKE